MRKTRMVMVAAGAVVALVVIAVLWNRRTVDEGKPVIFASTSSCQLVFTVHPQGESRAITPKYSGTMVFALWRDVLVGWSAQARYLVMLPLVGHPRAVQLHPPLPVGTQVAQLSPVADGVVCNLETARKVPCGALLVRVPSGQTTPVPHAVAVRSSEVSQTMAVLLPDGRIDLRRGDQVCDLPNVRLAPRQAVWDYRPEMDTLCYVQGHRIVMVRENGQRRGAFTFLGEIDDLVLQPDVAQLWVISRQTSCGSPGMRVFAYTLSGSSLGMRLQCPGATLPRPVRNASPHELALWEKYWGDPVAIP